MCIAHGARDDRNFASSNAMASRACSGLRRPSAEAVSTNFVISPAAGMSAPPRSQAIFWNQSCAWMAVVLSSSESIFESRMYCSMFPAVGASLDPCDFSRLPVDDPGGSRG
ncbi:hypothetical protein D1O33_25095 (plasmid) [Rhodococcus rhodochrous]|nr:hypothetical protein D1O33_25095 [Rhodococcus rhodochrous]